jgi:RNA polymerase sigma-70 factor (ECF subfamily)
LKVCLSQLTLQEQEIIAMKFGGEMTNREIAKTLGLSDSNVGIIIYRAVRKLRDSFGLAK